MSAPESQPDTSTGTPRSPASAAVAEGALPDACRPDRSDPWRNYFVAAYPPFSVWSGRERSAVETALGDQSLGDREVPLGLYVHIPFCAARCDYCFYLSYADTTAAQRAGYVDSLLAEWAGYARMPRITGRPLRFVYLGGGTPSLLGADEARRLLHGLQSIRPWNHAEEVTFECAPRSLDEHLAEALRDAGVTRLSLGIQSWDDAVLRKSRRIHGTADAANAVELARKIGFPIVNLDLIAGLPGDDEDTFSATVDRTVSWQPESVTIYQLEMPYHTPLSRRLRRHPDSAAIATPEIRRRWLGLAFDRLERAGYHVRSAYAAVRDPRRHAFVYQDAQYRGADVIGIGASAFSYCHGVHFQNLTSLEEYQSSVRRGERPVERAHRLGTDERFVREFVLTLKLGRADLRKLFEKFAWQPDAPWHRPLEQFRARGWLEWNQGEVRLTRAGLLRVDAMLPAFYLPEHQDVPYT